MSELRRGAAACSTPNPPHRLGSTINEHTCFAWEKNCFSGWWLCDIIALIEIGIIVHLQCACRGTALPMLLDGCVSVLLDYIRALTAYCVWSELVLELHSPSSLQEVRANSELQCFSLHHPFGVVRVRSWCVFVFLLGGGRCMPGL